MENPATWKRAEVIICDAYQEWSRTAEGPVCGLSLPRYIADQLRKEGLLNDADEPERGWPGASDSVRPEPSPPSVQRAEAMLDAYQRRFGIRAADILRTYERETGNRPDEEDPGDPV